MFWNKIVVVTQHYGCMNVQCRGTGHFKMVNFMSCEVNLN